MISFPSSNLATGAFLLLVLLATSHGVVCFIPAMNSRLSSKHYYYYYQFKKYSNRQLPRAMDTRCFGSRESDSKKEDEWKGYPTHYHLISSDRVILPGETVRLELSDEESIPLMQNALDNQSGTLVVGVNLEISDSNNNSNKGGWRLAQVASHCDIIGLAVADQDTNNNSNEKVIMDVACTGRVRLVELLEQYSDRSYRCEVEPINEFVDDQDFNKGQLLEENIRTLMKKASKMELSIRKKLKMREAKAEEEDSKECSDVIPDYMYSNFIQTKARVSRVIMKDVQRQYIAPYMQKRNATPFKLSAKDEMELSESYCNDIQSLVSTSWAVFLSLQDATLEARYRLRALDWDNLIERLKLAQYALREKELFLQGQLMLLQTNDDDDAGMLTETNCTVPNNDEYGIFQ